jgi:hypothetical protein
MRQKQPRGKRLAEDVMLLAGTADTQTPITTKAIRNATSVAALGSWPTPTALSPSTSEYNGAGDSCNLRKIRLLVSGPMPTGSDATTENSGRLNPAHSRWLMGYPPAWDVCAVTAMPSSRKSRPHSLVPISTVSKP